MEGNLVLEQFRRNPVESPIEEQLKEMMVRTTPDSQRCKYLQTDENGLPYCGRNSQPGQLGPRKCNLYDLELSCLNSGRACFYNN